MPSDLAKNSITIHNHPTQTTPNGLWKRSELWEVNKNNRPFSSTDFVNNIAREAKKAYIKALELKPNDEIILNNYGVYNWDIDTKESIESFKK